MGPSACWAARLAFQPIATAAAYVVPPARNHSHSKTGQRDGALAMVQPGDRDPSGQGKGSGGTATAPCDRLRSVSAAAIRPTLGAAAPHH